MQIKLCTIEDADTILLLYEDARRLQREKKMVVWPHFDKAYIENEIREQRQWKGMEGADIACNWVVTYVDESIWEEKENGDAIYLHRIVTNPRHRGNKLINEIVEWAKKFASEKDRHYVRLDTLGNNKKLIDHYTLAGFEFLGMFQLKDTRKLPAHYREEPNCCLFELAV